MTAATSVQASNGVVAPIAQERFRELERENESLTERAEMLERRVIVEQATQVMSVRFGMTPVDCYEMLRGLAASQHRELQEFAECVLLNQGCLDGAAITTAESEELEGGR